jgi:uncharacterized pyridoxamine 5'-phosphate oxidase family protein
MENAYEFLKESRVFFLATVSQGKPRVRPFGFCMKRNGRLYFCTSKRKDVYLNLIENPEIEICALSEGRDRWLRIRGIVEFDESEEAKAQVFQEAPHLLNIYPRGKDEEIFVTFFLNEAKAKLFSRTGQVKEIPLL